MGFYLFFISLFW